MADLVMAEKISGFIGRGINDSHGRPIGRLVGYYANTKNEVTSIEVESCNGDFFNCPVSHIMIEGDALTYIHPWEFEANSLKRQFDLIIRRSRALDELYSKGSLEKTVYEELRSQHISSIGELEEQKKVLVESLLDRSAKLDSQIKELELFLANCKMQHTAGEIDDNSYSIAFESVDKGFKRVLAEKSYLKEVVDFLNEAHLAFDEGLRDERQSYPEAVGEPDMVVIRVKDAGV
ncbi:MAG: CdvA-like protein [Candidatus Bathyarchaeia archaeon]